MKSQNIVELYRESIDKIHQFGIAVGGGFIFGFDRDDKSVFERTVKFAVESKLDYADFNILCPYPGTTIYRRFAEEDRIIETDWSKYFGMNNVVFRPKQISADELRDGCLWAWNEFYSYRSVLKRLLSKPNFKSWTSLMAYFALNIGTKEAISDFC